MSASSHNDINYLNGLRGLAALTVAVSHTANVSEQLTREHPAWWMHPLRDCGAFCVPVFIFLSGYLLAIPTLRHGFRLDSLTAFFTRRANRILPAYYAALAFALLVAIYVTHDFSKWQVIGLDPAFYGPVLLAHDFLAGSPAYDPPLWSLPVEVHIYLVFPLILWLYRKVSPYRAVVYSLAAACAGQGMFAAIGYPAVSFYLYGLFSLGVFASWYGSEGLPLPPVSLTGALLKAALLLCLAICMMAGTEAFFTQMGLLSVLFGIPILCAFAHLVQTPEGRLRRFLEKRPMQYLGRVSYSLYLTHWVVWSLIAPHLTHKINMPSRCILLMIVGLPTALLIASIFYRLFEHPFLSRRKETDDYSLRSTPDPLQIKGA